MVLKELKNCVLLRQCLDDNEGDVFSRNCFMRSKVFKMAIDNTMPQIVSLTAECTDPNFGK